jgi:hypothetical protein
MSRDKVLSTTDYSIFKKHSCNRDIQSDQAYLKKLENSIRYKNLLEYRPISVNAKMEVMDGQNRLEVAKRLGVPIYYSIDDKLEDEDIIAFNETVKRWGIEDYCNFWAQKGNANYQKIFEFCKKNTLAFSAGYSLLRGSGSKESNSEFKTGSYRFPSQEDILQKEESICRAHEISGLIYRKTLGPKKYLSSPKFYRSVFSFLQCAPIDFEAFMKRLEKKCDVIKICSNIEEYVKLLKAIYNFGNRDPIA